MYFLKPTFRTGSGLCAAFLTSKCDGCENLPVQGTSIIEENHRKGWKNVYRIFTIDEFGSISPEMNTICQTTFFTAFIGGCYGGFLQSRDAYLKFIERNQASSFVDHFEAKKKLQDNVTMSFAKGALKWSWRLAFFSGMYITYVSIMTAYRGDSSIIDYTLGGIVSGSIYQMKMGLRGAIVGGSLGAMLGLFAGSLTLSLLRFTGTTMDDVYQVQYEISKNRQRHFDEALEKNENKNIDMSLLKHHDQQFIQKK